MLRWTRKDENRPVPVPSAVPPVRAIPSEESVQKVPRLQSVESFRPDVTHIGKSIVIKGDVSGSGDVYLDGDLEGSVELLDGSLTVGSEGCIRANLQARSVVVQGRVDGWLTKSLILSAFPAFLVGAIIVNGLKRLGISEVTSFMISMPLLIVGWYYLTGRLLDRWKNERPRQPQSAAP